MKAHELFRQKYGTLLDQSQIINWVWYDTGTYTSAATTLLSFFNAVRATKDLGNMVVAGMLPAFNAFIIRALRIHIKREATQAIAAPHAVNDISRLSNNGYCEFAIGGKNYGVWPIWALPAGAGPDAALAGQIAAVQFLAHANHGVADPRAIYTLSQPLMIDPGINFQIDLRWTTAQTLSGNVDIVVALDGELMRPVQ